MNASSAQFILILGVPVGLGILAYYEYTVNCKNKTFLECLTDGLFSGAEDIAKTTLNNVDNNLDKGADSLVGCSAQKILGIGTCGGNDKKSAVERYMYYTPIGQVYNFGSKAVDGLKGLFEKKKKEKPPVGNLLVATGIIKDPAHPLLRTKQDNIDFAKNRLGFNVY